jgi:hypothetical protein
VSREEAEAKARRSQRRASYAPKGLQERRRAGGESGLSSPFAATNRQTTRDEKRSREERRPLSVAAVWWPLPVRPSLSPCSFVSLWRHPSKQVPPLSFFFLRLKRWFDTVNHLFTSWRGLQRRRRACLQRVHRQPKASHRGVRWARRLQAWCCRS